MKNYMRLVFATFLSLLPFCVYLNGLDIDSKTQMTKEIEIRNFVHSFIKHLDETKDLSLVPATFFVADFKTRFAKDNNYSGFDISIFNKLSEKERYEYNTLAFNVGYLGTVHAFGKLEFTEDGQSDDPDEMENLFPPKVIGLINENKLLKKALSDNDEFKIEKLDTFRNLVAAIKTINQAQRTYLINRPIEMKNRYKKNLKILREDTEFCQNEICSNSCEGFSKNTQILEFNSYPFELKIVRINDALKIFEVYMRLSY